MAEAATYGASPTPEIFSLLWRDRTALRLNEVLNDPAVRPWVADMREGLIDLTGAVTDPANILLMGEHGGCFFIQTTPGSYEVHTQVLLGGRGKWAFDFVRQVVAWVFTQSDAFEITTRIPVSHAGARRLAIHAGMKFEFRREKECFFRGEMCDVDIYSFRLQDWIAAAPELEPVGHDFHDKLHAAVRESGNEDEPHADDPNHNRYVGASILMAKAGQAAKAVTFYNRWAIASRHRIVELIQESPLALRFDAGTLVFLGDELKVFA